MALPFTNLAQLRDNVQASISGFVDLIKGRPGAKPAFPANTTPDLYAKAPQGNWNLLPFAYTFSVIDLTTGKSAGEFGDFALPLAPQMIQQSEEFAISIIPTQGGTTVTHSGNRYKTLAIKGTTGVAPFRGAGGASRKTGQGIAQPNALKFLSGYEVFHHLRNWFRSYYEFKKVNRAQGKNYRLVFKNFKDGEFLIVELLKFEMERQAGRPFLYDYALDFRVLSHLSFAQPQSGTGLLNDIDNVLGQALDRIEQARGAIFRAQDILRQIESTADGVIVEPLRQTSLALKALLGVPAVAADMGQKLIKSTVSVGATVGIVSGIQAQQNANKRTGDLDPRLASVKLPSDIASAARTQGADLVANLGEALMALDPAVFPESSRAGLQDEAATAAALPRSFYLNTLEEITRVKQNAEDFFNLGSPTYDSIFNRTATLSAPFTKAITPAELGLLQAFNDAAQAIRTLLSTDDLFRSSFDARIQDMIARFNGGIDLQSSAAARQIRYTGGVSLERLAAQELGDSTRWGEIVELNGLKAPYTTDDASDPRPNLLKPGAFVLIPAEVTSGFSEAPPVGEIRTTRGLNEVQKSLGSDLRLTEDFDLALTNSGDFDVVSSSENLAQAILLKLSYEPGEVIRHPGLGAGILPGQKFPNLDDVQDNLTRTLLADPRIEAVQDINLRRESSALTLSFQVKIKNVDLPIPLTIQV